MARELRGTPAPGPVAADLVDPRDPPERRAEKLERIATALIRRAERGAGHEGSAYGLFQRATALEDEVRARTRDLERVVDELNRVNAELEAATAAAEAANRAKTRFLAAASHDILQPLSAAKLFLASLVRSGLTAEQLRTADNLGHAFGSLESLLSDLLEISRLDTPSVATEMRAVALDDVLGPLAREIAPIAASRKLGFRFVPSSAYVLTDPAHLRRIVQNLLANAVHHTAHGGVVLGCRRRGEDIRIDVVDTGPGIPEDKLSDIFREFHRLAPEGDEAGPGAGLGLAIVERTCRLLGLTVEIASRPGRGSRFSITLPSAGSGALAGAAPLMDSIVLLVGSGPESRVAERLEGWGASVLQAVSLQEAAVLSSQLGLPPDAVVLVPDRTASGTCIDEAAIARALSSSVPVIRSGSVPDPARLLAEIQAAVTPS